MDRRQAERKEKKRSLNREKNQSSGIFIFSLIVAVLNYVFWHDQYIGLDTNYTIVFVVVPLICGIFIFYKIDKVFIKSILETKLSGIKDTILSYLFMFIVGLAFSYFSAVTLANMLFKVGMDISIKDAPVLYKSYVVKSTFRNDSGKRIHLFSSIHYLGKNGDHQTYRVPVNSITTSDERRIIRFKCKEGFLGYYKIIAYKLE
ncbi:hypothetical protein [Flavobacterium sp.]